MNYLPIILLVLLMGCSQPAETETLPWELKEQRIQREIDSELLGITILPNDSVRDVIMKLHVGEKK